MSDVIKRGRLEVKKKNLFGSAYKNRCVLLRNSLALNCKTVEILEGEEEAEESKDVIRLNDVWSVQEKPSRKGRFTFELIKGDEVILTFACGSVMEREEWVESFRILNQLALPCDTGQYLSKPITDYFQVALLKNRNAVEINHSGSYLLSISESAIVLHWKTGAIAHHWPKRSVVKFLHHPRKEGHLILHAKRSGTEDVVDFEFTTSPESSVQILKTWNIRLIESITFNPQKLNEISSVLNTSMMPSDSRQSKGRGMGSKSFRAKKNVSVKRDQDLKRADSFSKLQAYRTDIGGMPVAGGLSQGNVRIGGLPPLPREANTRSWGGIDDPMGLNGALGTLSQDSVFLALGNGLPKTPPPLPPRPTHKEYDNEDSDDPDYAYIKEDEVEGPKSARKQRPSVSVDDALSMLEQDIIRENRAKKKEEEKRRRFMTSERKAPRQQVPPVVAGPLSLGPRVHFPKPPQPQDYTDFVPKRLHLKSTSSEPEKVSIQAEHARSISEPDSRLHPSPSRSHAHQHQAVFESTNEDAEPVLTLSDHTPSDYSTFAPDSVPTLPPRSWRNTSASSNSSSGNPGNDLSESLSSTTSAVFVTLNEGGVASSGKDVSPTTSDNARLTSDGRIPASPDYHIPFDQKSSGQTTPPSTSEAPPTAAIAEETPSTAGGATTAPPPLPPRSSPAKEKLTRKSSNSSNCSNSSNGRCPRCRNTRRSSQKSSVGKTVSLDQRTGTEGEHDDCRKSLPDLADTKVPENSLGGGGGGKGHRHAHRSREHTHCSKCSPVSSTDGLHGDGNALLGHSTSLTNFDYLQLVGEEHHSPSPSSSSLDNELGAEMDLLNSCLQTLEYLEHKANATSADKTSTMTSVVSNHTPSPTPSGARQLGGTAAKQGVYGGDVQHRSVYTQARNQAQAVLAELSQPLQPANSVSSSRPGGHAGGHAGERLMGNGHTPHARLGKPTAAPPTTSTLPPSRGHHPNNGVPIRSATTMAMTTPPVMSDHAPPIPPRSMVSLTDMMAGSNQLASRTPTTRSSSQISHTLPGKRSGYNRSVSGSNLVGLPPNTRSASIGGAHATPPRAHPSLRSLNHSMGAQGQGSTVFIHHLKDTRRVGGLTHLV